jgi:CheY-like chemotaxis protein
MQSTLLVAESDANLRELYSRFLRHRGYFVAVVGDGVNCLQHLREAKPEALVLDLGLPWGGGDGVLDVLRLGDAFLEIPVILTATPDRKPIPGDLRARPVVDFLTKPLELTQLAASVCAAIAKKQTHANSAIRLRRSETHIG